MKEKKPTQKELLIERILEVQGTRPKGYKPVTVLVPIHYYTKKELENMEVSELLRIRKEDY